MSSKTGFTKKELEVLVYLSQGKPNKEIAKDLDITVRTVEHHITNIFRKFEVKNRTEAAICFRKILADSGNDGNPP